MQSILNSTEKRSRLVVVFALAFGLAFSTRSATAGDPPVITNFGWEVYFGDWYMFFGTVEHQYPDECFIGFSGLLEGHYTTVDSNGCFFHFVELPPLTSGFVDAIAVDNDFNLSDVASTYFYD